MACKHENADHLAPDYDTRGLSGWARVEQFRCLDCGAWLSLGPSNDEPDEVRIEIEAVRRVAEWRLLDSAPTGYDRFDWCPDMTDDRLCSRCESLFLARAIAEHKDSDR